MISRPRPFYQAPQRTTISRAATRELIAGDVQKITQQEEKPNVAELGEESEDYENGL